jgi:hypothetical protein
MSILRKIELSPRGYLLAGALLFVLALMFVPGGGEWYYQHIYVNLSPILTGISSLVPFSLSDCFIYGSILFLITYVVSSIVKRRGWKKTIFFICEYLLCVFVWFYLAWGLNYYRPNFYIRTETKPADFSSENFDKFISQYTDSLNASYVEMKSVDKEMVKKEVKKGYAKLAERFGFEEVKESLLPKPMLVKPLMNATGVLGYMGPFFNEYTLNQDLLPVQYPFTYAHEMAHVLGITNEAEANLYAYLVCSSSTNQAIRFSGYFGLLRYVLINAYQALTEEQLDTWRETINPDIRDLFNKNTEYWRDKYSDTLGEIQHAVYNMYLKGNKISSGHANYSEVIALLMALNDKDFEQKCK